MKKFLKKYGYLIYLGFSTLVISPFNIFTIWWWLMLIIMFIFVEIRNINWKNEDIIIISNICWVFILGVVISTFVPITSITWWIIDIPTVVIIGYKSNYLKERD